VSKTAEQNVALIRGLLRLEKSDRIRFEDEQGNSVVPDYCGLKDTAGYKVKIMVFIERDDGELLERLAHESARTQFEIYEDKPVNGWVIGKEDWNSKERCQCDDCMLSLEEDELTQHLEELAEENG
jgi:hypothetical protein